MLLRQVDTSLFVNEIAKLAIMATSNIFWLFIWYIFCAAAIAFFVFVYRLLNQTKFRSDTGETSEVGYAEDSQGYVIKHKPSEEAGSNPESPHISL